MKVRATRLTRATNATAGDLRPPPDCTLSTLSNPESRDAVTRWLRESPDHTLYHLGPYMDFSRALDRNAEVFLVSRDENPLFALTVQTRIGVSLYSGYTGVVFPATRRERVLRRSVAALAALLRANRHLMFHFHQSAQARAYDDPGRVVLLQRLLEGEGLSLEPIYGRLSDLDELPAADQIPTAPGSRPHALAIDPRWLTAESLRGYDPSLRNQIRQAIRNGLSVEYVRARDEASRVSAYTEFAPLHEESWTRTGLRPKPPGYWPRHSQAVTASGGEDLVVLVVDADGKTLAGVVCHAYQSRAIYWSGCSSERGLSARANPLCLHGAIAACRKLGVRTFELGRFRADEPSEKQRAITLYKAQFGGELVRVTTFASAGDMVARARAARAEATYETRRRLAVALSRARARKPGLSLSGSP
jgi:hypothetical protein